MTMEAAFKDADIIYAKSWGAMVHTPDPEEGAKIIKKYEHWITDERKMALAKPDAIYMHPLPADRNIEVTDGVMDGPQLGSLRRGRKPAACAEGCHGVDDVEEEHTLMSITQPPQKPPSSPSAATP